jgi:hypothetical protein
MIDTIQALAHHPIDWSIEAGPIWLAVGLLTVIVPMMALVIEDLGRGS